MREGSITWSRSSPLHERSEQVWPNSFLGFAAALRRCASGTFCAWRIRSEFGDRPGPLRPQIKHSRCLSRQATHPSQTPFAAKRPVSGTPQPTRLHDDQKTFETVHGDADGPALDAQGLRPGRSEFAHGAPQRSHPILNSWHRRQEK